MKQNKMIILGITGGVGAGKSTVLDYLKTDFDACCIQADQAGHLVMEPGEMCYDQVIALFGKHVIKKDKTIDRRAVSDVVFDNEEMRQKLNAIIHPAVKQYILQKIEEEQRMGRRLLVVEAALFFEEHYDEFCDQVWYIHADRKIRIARLMESRNYTREKAESIMARQVSEEFFREHADYVITNNGDLENTVRQIEEGINRL